MHSVGFATAVPKLTRDRTLLSFSAVTSFLPTVSVCFSECVSVGWLRCAPLFLQSDYTKYLSLSINRGKWVFETFLVLIDVSSVTYGRNIGLKL